MENLILPTLVVVILAIAAVMDYVDGKPERKERVLKVIGKAIALVVATVAISIIFGGVLYGAFAEEEIPWQQATANGSVEVTFNGETIYLVVFTTEEGEVLSYLDDTEVVKGTHLRVKISPCGETLNAEVEEPEPIWFPSFLLIGFVVPVEKKFKRAQKMPPDFYLPCSLFDKNTYIVYFVGKEKCFVKLDLDEALKKLASAAEKKIPAFVCTFVETYKQQAIVACNYCGFLEYWRNTAISDKVNAASALLRKGFQIIPVSTENKPVSKSIIHHTPAIISDKDNPVKMIVRVKYSKGSKEYTFRCRSAHFKGDFVTVEYHNGEAVEYKNTEVTYVGIMHQSELDALAKKLGYKEIAELYCERAIDTPEAWKEWGGKDPRVQVDPEDDPELYAPSAEEIAEFEAMREAYSPGGYRDF